MKVKINIFYISALMIYNFHKKNNPILMHFHFYFIPHIYFVLFLFYYNFGHKKYFSSTNDFFEPNPKKPNLITQN